MRPSTNKILIALLMKVGLTLGVAISQCGCALAQQGTPETYNAKVGIVNHTDRYIYAAHAGAGGGGHADRYSAGMANVCCVTLPVKWREGQRINVQWDMPEGTKHIWKEKEVDVEQYLSPGSLYLHFFPDDKVRVVVTRWVGTAPEHPIPRPIPPSENK